MVSLAAILEFSSIRVETSSRQRTERGVIKLLKKVRPDWPKEDIILQRFTEGFSNTLYGGYTVHKTDMILVKIYGNEDRDKDLEILTMRLFAAQHFGSRLFATFANGCIYEYAPGVPLNYDLCIDSKVYPVVARRIGEMHRQMKDQLSFYPNSGHVFHTLRQWLKQVPLRLADPEAHAKMKRELPSRYALERELDELEGILNHPEKNPLLLCHGDLSPSNIIYNPARSNVLFIDFQLAGPNFQAFEIASHFMMFAGGDLDKVGRNEYVPAKEFQMRWLQTYLTGYKELPPHKIPFWEIERLWVAVQKFSLVFCLQEIVWSLIRVENTAIPGFDILQYGALRFQQYHRNKYPIVQMLR